MVLTLQVDTLLVEETAESDLQYLEDSMWRLLKPSGFYFLITATPMEGIEYIFSRYAWKIQQVGKEELNTEEEQQEENDDDEDGEKRQKQPTSQSSNQQKAVIYFFKLSK